MDLSLILRDKSKKWDDFETIKSPLYFDFSSKIWSIPNGQKWSHRAPLSVEGEEEGKTVVWGNI